MFKKKNISGAKPHLHLSFPVGLIPFQCSECYNVRDGGVRYILSSSGDLKMHEIYNIYNFKSNDNNFENRI